MLPCASFSVDPKLVEGAVPTPDMSVAAFDVAERRLMEELRGFAVALLEGDGDERVDVAVRARVPLERKHQALVWLDFAIDAAKPAFAGIARVDHAAIGAADAHIHLRLSALVFARAHPMLEMLRVGPKRKHDFG